MKMQPLNPLKGTFFAKKAIVRYFKFELKMNISDQDDISRPFRA